MTTLLAFIIVLGVLVFFHELGHFLAARLLGVGVEKFSLGFGPRILGKTIGMTDYRISAIPLGGYVKMKGEEPGAEIDPADIPFAFTYKHPLKKMVIVAAGPLFNLFLAVLIFFAILITGGLYYLEPIVGEAEAGLPAHEAGLVPGDRILSIDGKAVKSWDEMAEAILDSQGAPLTFGVKRGEETFFLTIKPTVKSGRNVFGEKIERFVIGISASGDVRNEPLGLVQAVGESFVQTAMVVKLTVLSVVKMIHGDISAKDNLGGPIKIAQMAGQQYKAGLVNFLGFMAVLSISLAILNILPIPVLDGGHLVFYTAELITKRPVNIRMREIAQQIGLLILLLLIIFVIYNDLSNLF